MPDPIFLTIPLSSQQSSATFIGLANRLVAFQVPSLSPAVEVRWQASASSGTGPFGDVLHANLNGVPFSVASGNGPAWSVLQLPTAFGRFSCSSALSVATSIGIYQLNR
jgi:hypothetical protein